MEPADLERVVDRHLRTLPVPRAPRTLLPRVMAAVEQSSNAPWYRRGWVAWPLTWQAVSVLALIAVVAGFVLARPYAAALVAAVAPHAQVPVPTEISAAARAVDASWDAARILWRVLVQPMGVYLVTFVFVMSAACVAFGTALGRVALGGVSEV